jgi:ABC-type multidrug transport system fused ATPase/permease subunit
LLLITLALAEAALMLTLPMLGGRLARSILSVAGPALWGILALLLLALAVASVLRATMEILSGRTAVRILADLRCRIHDHLMILPLSFHNEHTQGDLLALSTYETTRLSNLLTGPLVSVPAQLLTAGGAVVLMARINLPLGFLVPVLVPFFYVVLRIVGRRLRNLARQIQEAEARVVAAASEDLAILPAIKSFVVEEVHARRFAARADAQQRLSAQETTTFAILGPLTNYIAGVSAVLLFALAGRQVQAEAMSASDLVSFLLYAYLLTRPIGQLSSLYGNIQSSRGTLVRMGCILEAAPEPGWDAPRRLGRARGEVSFEDVEFAYAGRGAVLRGLSLRIKVGETVAITGPNGAGKSTAISLLLRFADPQAGRIQIDGTDIREIALHDLRRQVGLVPQRPLLFNGSVRENIGFGRAEATPAAVEAAARLAQAHEFIGALPQSYETVIGENGVRLSGGQGQRLALARALMNDPPILVLDEATSMFDLEGEAAFVEAAALALRGRTVLLITHRPTSLALADRVVTLEAGQIVAERSAA